MQKERPIFKFTVDGEAFETEERILTPHKIMAIAGVDPDNHYLILVKGRSQESFEGRANEEIHMHQNMQFISVPTGPTPVS